MADSTSAVAIPAEKLVRDKLADKLDPAEYRIADESEMVGLLVAKIREEVEELSEALLSGNRAALIEEHGDVCVAVSALTTVLGPEVVGKVAEKWKTRGGFEQRIVLKLQQPVPMVFNCPDCGGQHIDRGIWATTRIHRSHLCEHCGHVWKPFDYATVGVESLPP